MSAPFAIDRPDIVFETVVDVTLELNPNVSRAMLLSPKREEGGTAQVRMIAMYLMANDFSCGTMATARQFQRDKSTVRYAVLTVGSWSAQSEPFRELLDIYHTHIANELEETAELEREGGHV